MKKHNIIMCAYYFPPTHSVAVLRNYTFAQHFNDLGHKVHVITPRLAAKASKDTSFKDISSISKHSIFKFDYRSFIPWFNRSGNIHLTDAQRRKPWKQWVIKLINTIPFNFLIGEGGLIYILMGYRKGKALIQASGTAPILFSSFRPYADHYICWLLKKRFPECKWIADFRDLHVDPLYKHVLNPEKQERKNKKILAHADEIITVSEGLAVSLRRLHERVSVIENPVRPYDIETLPDKYEKFTVSYTGSLYGEERDPSMLFEAIKHLNDQKLIDKSTFQLIYAGKDEMAMRSFAVKYNVLQYLVSEGFVERSAAVELQQKAHVNLLLTSSIPEMRGILTGKLFEYLSDYNPILTIINGDRDWIFDELYERFDLGCLVYMTENHAEKLANYLKELFLKWQSQEALINMDMRKKVQQHYSWTDKLEPLLSD